MNAQDDLREIWHSQPALPARTGEDIMTMVQERTRRFDRTIWMRNLIECIAGGVVCVLFLWVAVRNPDTITKTGALIVAASAVWIIFYLVRYGKSATRVDPAQNLTSYTHALIERYDRQIRLLRSAKYWYLLPMYVGLLTISVGILSQHTKAGGMNWEDVLAPAFYTAVFAAIWWLNECVVVRRLEQSRSEALSMTEANEFQDEFTTREQ